mmetsp:Transcript_28000/g.41226  ORF Transcript_28000/g.41226 Transcript_28000/m.41226 type:complete len:82 (-) Transcript_28000:89-334(-)
MMALNSQQQNLDIMRSSLCFGFDSNSTKSKRGFVVFTTDPTHVVLRPVNKPSSDPCACVSLQSHCLLPPNVSPEDVVQTCD